jgi:hypothetical protein
MERPPAKDLEPLLELLARAAYEAIARGEYKGPASVSEKRERPPEVPTKRPAA